MAERSFRYMPNSVNVMLSLNRGTGRTADNSHVSMSVSTDGLIEVNLPMPAMHKGTNVEWERRAEIHETLIEWGVAEWRRIGPEDSELFLTDEWAERLAPQLSTLTGWEDLPDPEEET